MPNLYIEKIREQLETVNKEKRFLPAEVLHFIVNLRQHIEAEKLSGKYERTMFYCNWCLHSQLNRRNVQGFLGELTRVLNEALAFPGGEYQGQHELNEMIDDVNEVISLCELRREIREILRAEGISSILFDTYNGWVQFVSVMAKSIIETPLLMNSPASPGTTTVESLRIVVDKSPSPRTHPKSSKSAQNKGEEAGFEIATRLHIELLTSEIATSSTKPKGVKFLMPLLLQEGPADFR